MKVNKNLRICEKGHQYYKSSNCQSCPTCDKENKTEGDFLSLLSAPARRALIHEGIDTLKKLSNYAEEEILKLHGVGPASLPILRNSLEEDGLSFNK